MHSTRPWFVVALVGFNGQACRTVNTAPAIMTYARIGAREPHRTAGIMPRERFARGLFQFNAQLLASCPAPRFLSSSRSARFSLVGASPLHMRALPLCGLVVGLSRIMQPREIAFSLSFSLSLVGRGNNLFFLFSLTERF